jgi:Cu-Zn family superoxide dismutase
MPTSIPGTSMPTRSSSLRAAACVLLALGLATGCQTADRINEDQGRVGIADALLNEPTAVAGAAMMPVDGGGSLGSVTFAQYGDIVVVRARLLGLPSDRVFGLHVHEGRTCADRASSVGAHFNPGNAPHGRPGTPPHHAGDLPNLRSDADGFAGVAHDTRALSITIGAISVLGRVVVVSSRADDHRTPPAGNSGAPLACGFIRREGRVFSTPGG